MSANTNHNVSDTSWFADESCLIAMVIGVLDHNVSDTLWLKGDG